MSYFEHYAKGKRLAKQAVKDDEAREYKKALEKYVMAAGELMKSIQFDHEEKRRQACKKAAARYVKRAEVLKVHLETREKKSQTRSEKKRDDEGNTKKNSSPTTSDHNDGLHIPDHIVKKDSPSSRDNMTTTTITTTPSQQQEHTKREKLRSVLQKMKPALLTTQHNDSPLPEECNNTPLPKHWHEYKDPKSGTPYFHNSSTGVTTWERPPDDKDAQPVILKIRFKGKSYDLEIACANRCTLDGLRRRVEALTKIPCAEQKLIFKGKTFTPKVGDTRNLTTLGLKSGSRIMVMTSRKTVKRQILKNELSIELNLHLISASSSTTTATSKQVTTGTTTLNSLYNNNKKNVTYFCSGVGFLEGHETLKSSMRSVPNTLPEKCDVAVIMVPSDKIDKITTQKLQAVANEANKIILNARCVMGLEKEEDMAEIVLKGTGKKRIKMLQEMITLLLLRLDNVPVNPTTRVMRKIQVKQLLRTSEVLDGLKIEEE